MYGPLHRVVRWLKLALACLALAGAIMPAHALPRTQAAVVAVQQQGSERQRAAADTAPEYLQAAALGSPWRAVHAPCAGGVREALAPSPPRRLFLVHRALLR